MTHNKSTCSSPVPLPTERVALLQGDNRRPLFVYASVVGTDGMGATLFDVGERDGRCVVPGDVVRLDERPGDAVVRATLDLLGLFVEPEGVCSVLIDLDDPAHPVSLVYRC